MQLYKPKAWRLEKLLKAVVIIVQKGDSLHDQPESVFLMPVEP